jgi:phosphoglycerate dehydrogenase-like enzyme
MKWLPLLLILFQAAAAPAAPSQAVQALIEEFSLQESERAAADYRGWAPRKVVVGIPGRFLDAIPGSRERLQAAAGEVKLVFATGESLAAELAGADALLGFCTPEVMNAVDQGFLWLHSLTAGVDRCSEVDIRRFDERLVTNSKRLMGPNIAEHTIAMLMSLARNFPAMHRAQAERRWDRSVTGDMRFGEVAGKTLLVAGLGGIGTEVARRAHGLGMRVIATRNSSRSGPEFVDYVGLADELEELAGRADVIVNALPLTDDTRDLFDQAFFAASKPGAIFLSIGRGGSTVTEDLIAALRSGQLYGAGLDVTDPEPLPPESPLWTLPNVIITPHLSGAGVGSLGRMLLVAEENLRRYVAGEKLLNAVDMAAGY